MKILNISQKTTVAKSARLADTAATRLKGLLGENVLAADTALIITQCRSIHMFFMRFAIDVIFIDAKNVVVGVVPNIKPFQMSPYFPRATDVIEAPCGTIQASQTSVGNILELQE